MGNAGARPKRPGVSVARLISLKESGVRTSVSLEGMNALLDFQLHNPSDVLGPQTIWHAGRKMLAVRAFLPDSQQAWVVDPAHEAARPMRRIHPAGLFEAICPHDTLTPQSLRSSTQPTSAARPSAAARGGDETESQECGEEPHHRRTQQG